MRRTTAFTSPMQISAEAEIFQVICRGALTGGARVRRSGVPASQRKQPVVVEMIRWSRKD